MTKLMTPIFRVSYAYLLQPKPNRATDDANKEPKYSLMIVLPKNEKSTKTFIAELEAALAAASLEKHGKAIPKAKLKHWPIKDGDAGNADGDVDANHAGCFLINVSSKRKPQVIDKKGRLLIDPEEVYSGMWARVTVHCWGWDNPKSGKGCSVDLDNVLKVRDDEQLGAGGTKAEDDFKEEMSEEDDDLV